MGISSLLSELGRASEQMPCAQVAMTQTTSVVPDWSDGSPRDETALRPAVLRPVRRVAGGHEPLPAVLGELGLTYPQFLVLVVLWDEGTRTVREIAEALRLDQGADPLLRRMQANGLVVKSRSSTDERFVEISLTPEGDALRSHSVRIHCAIKDTLGLDEDQFTALQQTLRTLTDNATPPR